MLNQWVCIPTLGASEVFIGEVGVTNARIYKLVQWIGVSPDASKVRARFWRVLLHVGPSVGPKSVGARLRCFRTRVAHSYFSLRSTLGFSEAEA